MKANPGKYHLLLSVSDYSKIAIGNKIISSSKCKKLFEIIIGNNLNFKEHIEFLLFFIYLFFFYLFIHLSIFFFLVTINIQYFKNELCKACMSTAFVTFCIFQLCRCFTAEN